MNIFINYAIESSIILIVLYIIYFLFYANDRNFRFNRIYLLTAPVLAILFPLLHIPFFNNATLPELQTIQQAIQLPEFPIQAAEQPDATGLSFSLFQIALIIYLAGVVFFVFRFAYQIILLLRIVRMSKKRTNNQNSYTLVETRGKFPTCSFFKYLLWDNTLLLVKEEKEQILHHEEAHIKQGHSYDVLYFEIMRAIFWFNPAIHGFKKALSDIHEYLADEQASAKTGQQSYLSLLAKQILISFNFSVSNNFHQSQTSKRMKMIKNNNRKRPVWIKLLAVVPAVAILFFIFSCDLGNSGLNNNEETIIPEYETKINPVDTEGDSTNEVFTMVEDQPTPYGGMEAFYEFISEEITYPEEARNNKVEGRIFVQFVVDEAGVLTNVKTVKGIGFGCNEEGERVVRNSPKWKPGKQKGRKVKVRMIIPINFQLSQKTKQKINNVKTESNSSDQVLTRVENKPHPVDGGMRAFIENIRKEIIYPEEAKKNKVEGMVFVQFVVDETGVITDVKSVKGIGFGCDKEAIRIVKNSPKWNPGTQKGKPVKVRMIIPITFKLK